MNVLTLIVDQQHASWLGCAGHPHALTPNLDRLAAEGQRWTGHHAPAVLCTPSRVCVLSGQNCLNHGYYGISGPAPTGLPTLFGHFKAHGYRTAGIGKLHLPNRPHTWGLEDLDVYADSQSPARPGEMNDYNAYLEQHGLLELDDHKGYSVPELQGVQRHWDAQPSAVPLEHCVESWISNRAIEFLDQQDDRPFFMQLSYPRPHHCLSPDRTFWDLIPEDVPMPPTFGSDLSGRPDHFRERVEEHRRDIIWMSEPKTYEAGAQRAWRATLALVAQNDFFIGKVMEALKARGLYEDTLIVYTSDHGAYHGEYGLLEKAPGINSDAVCRVPLIWRMPGMKRSGECSALSSHVDLAPTLSELCGLPPMPTADGESLAGWLREGPPRQAAERAVVTECPLSKSIRIGDWRLVHTHRRLHDGRDVGELYHLAEDPDERHNRYYDPACGKRVAEMRRRLLEWMCETRRISNAWPPLPEDALMPDGHEAAGGLWNRKVQGVVNTFDPRDYL